MSPPEVLQRAVCALLRVTPVEPGAPNPNGLMPIGQPLRPTRKVRRAFVEGGAESDGINVDATVGLVEI